MEGRWHPRSASNFTPLEVYKQSQWCRLWNNIASSIKTKLIDPNTLRQIFIHVLMWLNCPSLMFLAIQFCELNKPDHNKWSLLSSWNDEFIFACEWNKQAHLNLSGILETMRSVYRTMSSWIRQHLQKETSTCECINMFFLTGFDISQWLRTQLNVFSFFFFFLNKMLLYRHNLWHFSILIRTNEILLC